VILAAVTGSGNIGLVKIGIQFQQVPTSGEANLWDAAATFARAADDSGLDSFWMFDHVMQPFEPPNRDAEAMLDSFVGLGAIAAITSRVTLGQCVAAVSFRSPALTAKMATTLDLTAHGRSVLGLGAGWNQREYDAYGWDFEDAPTRLKRLEEAVQVILELWKESARPASFDGRFYRLDKAVNEPPPHARPHPPLMIGGSGEKVTLRITAQYADWCNVGGSPHVARQKLEVLDQHCERLGRDPRSITRSNFMGAVIGRTEAEARRKREALGPRVPGFLNLVGAPPQIIDCLGEYARAGSQHSIIQLTGETDPDVVRLLASDIAPALRDA
jgi:F420-dependent oxidoreductase-like protein